MKLPICVAPIQVKRDPTVWLSTEAARDWVARVIADRTADMTLEETFRLHDRTFGGPAKAYSTACPADDPCPATGCPACCPSYDPCHQPECNNCRTRLKRRGELATPYDTKSSGSDRNFWSLHEFQEVPDSISCSLCGWGFHDPIHPREDEVHVPEEAELSKAALEAGLSVSPEHPLVERSCVHHCVTDGLNYPECPLHGKAMSEETDLEECDWVVRHATLETPDEYCGLPALRGKQFCPPHQEKMDAMEALENNEEAFRRLKADRKTYPYNDGDVVVLGPGIFVNPIANVICWEGENYYHYEDIQTASESPLEKLELRKFALRAALSLQEAGLKSGIIPSRNLTEVAQDLLTWITKED